MREHYCYSNMALLCEGAVLGSMTSTEDRTAYGLQLIWVGRASGIKGWGKKKKKLKKNTILWQQIHCAPANNVFPRTIINIYRLHYDDRQGNLHFAY